MIGMVNTIIPTMTNAELNFMIAVWGPINIIVFSLTFYLIGRGIFRSIRWAVNHIRALYKRRHFKLVHSNEQSVSSSRSENKLRIVD